MTLESEVSCFLKYFLHSEYHTYSNFWLHFQCINLRALVEKQREELQQIKQHIALRTRSPSEEKRRHKSTAEARTAQRLIQRVISAAKLAASQNSRTSHKTETSHDNRQNQGITKIELERKETVVRDDVPEVYLESDIDGLCYLAGPRRKSLRDDINNNSDNNSQ